MKLSDIRPEVLELAWLLISFITNVIIGDINFLCFEDF